MKKSTISAAILTLLTAMCGSTVAEEIKEGDVLQALTNLHPDPGKRLVYTVNYQQAGLIPACAEIKVTDMGRKRMEFEYQGLTYRLDYEGHTKKAGISFQQAAQTYFGPACDKAKMDGLSDTDKEGIKAGMAKVGMTKDGVYFAMGRPPYHANPTMDANEWMYWRNRFARRAITFNSEGTVSGIR